MYLNDISYLTIIKCIKKVQNGFVKNPRGASKNMGVRPKNKNQGAIPWEKKQVPDPR